MPRKYTAKRVKKYTKKTYLRRKRVYKKRSLRRKVNGGVNMNRTVKMHPARFQPFPNRIITKLNSDLEANYYGSCGQDLYFTIPANCMYDLYQSFKRSDVRVVSKHFNPSTPPNIPVGLDLYMPSGGVNPGTGLMYQKYQVHGCKVSVTIKIPDNGWNFSAWLRTINSENLNPLSAGSTRDAVVNNRNAPGSIMWDQNGSDRIKTRSIYVDNAALEGLTKAEYNANENYQVDSAINAPSKLTYIQLGIVKDNYGVSNVWDTDATKSLMVRVRVTYYVEFFDFSSDIQQQNV